MELKCQMQTISESPILKMDDTEFLNSNDYDVPIV